MQHEQPFIEVIRLINKARANAYQAVNTELINLYWNIAQWLTSRRDTYAGQLLHGFIYQSCETVC